MFDEVPKPIQVSRKQVVAGVLLSAGQIVIGAVDILRPRSNDSVTFGIVFVAIGALGMILWLVRERQRDPSS
jgi:hypothetical protein